MGERRVLKKSSIGFEAEFFTINNSGYITNAADRILKLVKRKSESLAWKECAHNMIEIGSYPKEGVQHTMENLIAEIETVIAITEKEDVHLCPLGAYPGRFNPEMRADKPYMIKSYIFGRQRFKIAGRCIGFHCHYTLPRGIFDSQMRVLKILVNSKIKDSVVNSYNLLIAADPALTTLMQSSPFYQGRLFGKDARVIMYRGGEDFSNKNGLYANYEEFGCLPPYKLTALDIVDLITTRYEKWKAKIKSLGINIKLLPLYGSVLNTTWAPVKVNPHGTLEQRGMDMNHPGHIMGVGTIINYLLKKLQEEDKKAPIRPYTNYKSHPYVADRIRMVKQELSGEVDFNDYMNKGVE